MNLKIGDVVITHYGERGVIVREARDNGPYDFWIDIDNPRSSEGCTREPYRASELILIPADQRPSGQSSVG